MAVAITKAVTCLIEVSVVGSELVDAERAGDSELETIGPSELAASSTVICTSGSPFWWTTWETPKRNVNNISI